ncbi:MAG: hypothetical protein GY797_35605 [Deltaproteobacteria bacterium]|nr:hypothetical protein [Deltaproteobacteria bacterium]
MEQDRFKNIEHMMKLFARILGVMGSVPNIFLVQASFSPQRRKDANTQRKAHDGKRLFSAPLRLCGEKMLGTEE